MTDRVPRASSVPTRASQDRAERKLSWVETLAARPHAEEASFPAPLGASRYLVAEVIGAGGMGVVYVAEDLQLERQVAVKSLRKEYLDDESLRSRFLGEALVLASLDHPGAVPIHEVGTLPGGEPFYAMKRLSGRTLRELLSERTDEEVRSRESLVHHLDLFERVCETVAAAHAHGLLHRDLKPENVMVDPFGSVFVLDWGLAATLTPAGPWDRRPRLVPGEIAGTPGHMAPEQLRGVAEETGPPADVFALGTILYEILSGRSPFSSELGRDCGDRTLHEEPPSPRKLNGAVDRPLAAICARCLAKEPAGRYPSARELAREIRRYRELRPVEAAPPRPLERLLKWLRRHPRVASALATLVAVAIVWGVVAGLRSAAERRLVDGAMAVVDEARAGAARLGDEVARMEARRSAATGAEAERLGRAIAELRALEESEEARIVPVAAAVTGYTLSAPDPRARALLRADLERRVDGALEAGHPLVAATTARRALVQVQQGNRLGLGEADVQRLRQRLAEAEAAAKALGLDAALVPGR